MQTPSPFQAPPSPGALFEANFSSLLLTRTSFICGNRPFHLLVTVLAAPLQGAEAGEGGAQALACLTSPPIHVDARRRTRGERPPDAEEADVGVVGGEEEEEEEAHARTA